jgi:dipeptidyl aminopeptidase/acylaminoacyl peptidase
VRFLDDDIDVPGGSYWQRSPVFHAAKATTPTLVGAGLHDRCTPPGQAQEFYQALVLAGVPARLEIAPNEAHGWTPGEGGLLQHAGVLEWIETWCPPH